MKVLKVIPTLDDNRLYQLFLNALKLKDTEKEDEANLVLNGIQKEWKRRKEAFVEGKYKSSLPKMGMLATLGYHVGETQGVKKKFRQEILKYIVTEELPLVQSPAYTLEWGEKNTCKRLKKLSNSLSAFIYDAQQGYKANSNFDMAIMDWSDDLEFLKENFYGRLNCNYDWPNIIIKND